MNVEFNFQDVNFDMPEQGIVADWINYVIEKEDCFTRNITYIFMSDHALLDINKQYLQHDYYTDIITFDYVKDNFISGDMFISVDRVEENAKIFGCSFKEELLRVIIHGVLHLVGYDDLTDEQETEIHRKEDEYLEIYFKKFDK